MKRPLGKEIGKEAANKIKEDEKAADALRKALADIELSKRQKEIAEQLIQEIKKTD